MKWDLLQVQERASSRQWAPRAAKARSKVIRIPAAEFATANSQASVQSLGVANAADVAIRNGSSTPPGSGNSTTRSSANNLSYTRHASFIARGFPSMAPVVVSSRRRPTWVNRVKAIVPSVLFHHAFAKRRWIWCSITMAIHTLTSGKFNEAVDFVIGEFERFAAAGGNER